MNSTARVAWIRTQAAGKRILRKGLALAASCLLLGQLAAAAGVSTANASSTPAAAPPVAPARSATNSVAKSQVDGRVAVLTRTLKLDAAQQLQLTRVLERRREQISQVWSDASVPAAYRISATRRIEDKTADQIRALLTDEQKKKYNPPRPPHKMGPDADEPSVEDWMKATQQPVPPPVGH
jgi:protein CpxP